MRKKKRKGVQKNKFINTTNEIYAHNVVEENFRHIAICTLASTEYLSMHTINLFSNCQTN